MKISVIIPSRGRPLQLAAVLHSLHLLESNKHEVTYGVACDEDDPETKEMCLKIKDTIPLAHCVGHRPPSLGGLVNMMAEHMPADVYTALGDDLICTSLNWDQKIADAVEETPHGVFWWKNALPELSFFTICTEKWRAAAGGIFTDYYPFWFDDLCLVEMWMVATDQDPLRLEIFMADKPVSTIRMRDLNFWCDFFTATRPLRIQQGIEIARKLGLPEPKYVPQLDKRIKIGLEKMPKERLEEIENRQGEVNVPPDPSYLMAKARAERILASISDTQLKEAA